MKVGGCGKITTVVWEEDWIDPTKASAAFRIDETVMAKFGAPAAIGKAKVAAMSSWCMGRTP